MTKNAVGRERPASNVLHPNVYLAMIGLAVVLVLSIWSLAGTKDEDLIRAVISAFIFFAVLIPATAWWTWRRHQSRETEGDAETFRDWESDEFDTWQERMTGRDAAIQVLLPLAAVSIGMAVFAALSHLLA